MKTRSLLLISLFAASTLHAQSYVETYSRLLAKYVTPSGVRYSAWKANSADVQALQDVVNDISKNGPANDRNSKLAYYMNAYNAWILYGVIEKYPVKSIRDIAPLFGFFTSNRIVVAGEKMSQNKLEKEIIIKRFDEPRIHFAINCASASCPPLMPRAFTAATLDADLDKLATKFLNSNPKGLKLSDDEKSVAVSKIFEWNADAFKKAGGVLAFINQYRKEKLPGSIKLTYQDYDWSLNEAK